MKRKSPKESHATKEPIVVVDSSSVTYAAFHTMGHLSNNGQRTGVIYGYLQRILHMAIKFKTNRFITCWDAGRSWRHKVYPEYKLRRWQTREERSEAEKKEYESLLVQSVQLCHEILPQMGFRNNFIQLEYEADDLIGYWINKLKNSDRRIILVTTDADMFQCLDSCDIWFPTKKKYFTEKDMLKKYGVTPVQWPMAKAIGGCQGDGVIGIEGASDPKNPKSKALKYIRGEIKKGKLYDRIEAPEGKAIIDRNLPLVTIPGFPEEIKTMILRRNKYSRKRFIKVFSKFYFKSFLEKDNFRKWEKAFNL